MAPISRKSRVNIAVLAAVAGLTSLGSMSYAATFTWDQEAAPDFSWNNATNWTANSGTPGAADTANWSGGSTPTPSTVSLTQNEAVNTMNVVNKVVTFNLNNFTLAIGTAGTDGLTSDGDTTNNTIFNGPGNANLTGDTRIGRNVASDPTGWSQVTAQGGAHVTSGYLSISDYRGGGIVNVTGAGTVWNSAGNVLFSRGTGSFVFTQPRAQLLITAGGVFNHDRGTTNATSKTFNVSQSSLKDSYIKVDGPGSQFNFLGDYGDVRWGGAGSAVTVDVTNGGLFRSAASEQGLSFNQNANANNVNTFNVNGTGSIMTADRFALAGRNTSDFGTGNTVVNVGVGGLFEATGSDGNDRSITIGDRGRLSLQGGTVNMPTGKDLFLGNSTTGIKSTLEGFGTVSSGNVNANQDSRITPGVSGAGTIRLTTGNLTTAAGAAPAELLFELNTTTGNPHDMIGLNSATSTATIGDNSTSAITYSVLGGGPLASGAGGFMDFLIGGTVSYGGTVLGADVPNIDNLDDLLAAAGYARVGAAVTPGAGQYRYYLATVGAGDYAGEFAGQQALRLDFAPGAAIPEPASLALLGLGAVGLLRRRRA